MKKVAAALMLLIFLPSAMALPAIIIGALLGAGIISAGIAGFYLGSWLANDNSEERLAELEAQLTSSQSINDALFRQSLIEQEGSIRAFIYETQDFVNYSKNYVWALVKYKVWECKNENKTVAECWDIVNQTIKDFYANQTINIVTMHNTLAKGVMLKLNKWHSTGVLDNILTSNAATGGETEAIQIIVYSDYYGSEIPGMYGAGDYDGNPDTWEAGWLDMANPTYVVQLWADFWLYNETVTVAGKTYNLTTFKCGGTDGTSAWIKSDTSSLIPVLKIYVKNNGTWELVYDYDLFKTALDEVNAAYNFMVSNAEAYVTDVYVYNVTAEEVIDPYVLATFLSQNINETGYYGYYAAEMALLGLPTNVTSAFVISINGTNYTGFLFTDAFTVINVSETYAIPTGAKAYFVDENGNLYILEAGTNFTVLKLFNPATGEELNSTTLIQYVTHSGDVTKIAEELQKLYDLYEQILQMTPTPGGGGFDDWWASLSDTEKVLLIAVVLFAVALIARK